MPRTKHPISTITVRVPKHIIHPIQLLYLDPSTGRVRYGELSALVTRLLATHLASLQTPQAPSCPSPATTTPRPS